MTRLIFQPLKCRIMQEHCVPLELWAAADNPCRVLKLEVERSAWLFLRLRFRGLIRH